MNVGGQLPHPQLRKVYRLEASLAEPLDLGDTAQGRRRIVALTGGAFTGPEISGKLLPGVDASEYIFRASTQIETAAPDLDWLNKGVFISVAGRQAAGVIYETYLVG